MNDAGHIDRLDLKLRRGQKYLSLLMGDLRPSRITIEDVDELILFSFLEKKKRHYRYLNYDILEISIRHGRERYREIKALGKAGKKIPKRPKGWSPPFW